MTRGVSLLAFAWAILVLAPLAAAQGRVAPELAARAAAGESVRVLVELAAPFAPEADLAPTARGLQRGAIARARNGLAADLAGRPHRVTRSYRALPLLALEAPAAALEALARSPYVLRVSADDLHAPLLDVSAPLVQADQAVAIGADGGGQAIVVIDTGVDAAHPNLAGKVVAEACFAAGAVGPAGDCPNGSGLQTGPGAGTYCTWSDECFHGTHVAGIAAGEGPSYDGVATGADVISIQVGSRFTSATSCGESPVPCVRSYESDVIAALEEVYEELRFGHAIAAVNLSLGGDAWTSQAACDADNGAWKAVIDLLRAAGIATVAASGNDGLADAISEPACVSSAVSVGATNDAGNPRSWANRAPFLSLWAPGTSIRAPDYGTTGYLSASGTSMAAPHVAGAFAILRGVVPAAGVGELLAALQATGAPVAPTARIRIRDALDAVTVACANGLDDDRDGLADLVDPGCAGAGDDDERGTSVCDDGVDNDGDGRIDVAQDPGCGNPSAVREDPACQNGGDDDGDGAVDFDGGASLNDGEPIAAPDPQCGVAWQNRETPGCGLGAELAPALAALRWRRRGVRLAARARPSS